MGVTTFDRIAVGDQRAISVRVEPADENTATSVTYSITRRLDPPGYVWDPGGACTVTNDNKGTTITVPDLVEFPRVDLYTVRFVITWADGQVDHSVIAEIPCEDFTNTVVFDPVTVGDQRAISVRVVPSDEITATRVTYTIARQNDPEGAIWDPGGDCTFTNDNKGTTITVPDLVEFPRLDTYFVRFVIYWADGVVDHTVIAQIPCENPGGGNAGCVSPATCGCGCGC